MIEQYSKVTWLKVRKIVESCPCFHRYLSLPVINIFARGNLTSWIMIFHEGSLSISEEETFYFPTGILCLLRTSTCKPRSVLRLIKRDTRENTFLFYDTHWLWQNIVWQYPDGKSWLVCFFCEDFNAGTLLFTLQRDSCVEVRPAICVTVYDRLEMVWHGLKG